MDTSTEELQRLLAETPRGLLYMRDELTGWLGSFDRYSGNGADRAFFLECWNGGAYVCDRVGYHGEPIRIEHASLAIIGGMVPDRLRSTLSGADDGLSARLYVWPEPVSITPLADRGDTDASQRRDMLMAAARRLRSLEMGADQQDIPAPMALRPDADARELFDHLRREWMERARNASGLASGWAGKNPGRALRLVMVFELLAWAVRGGTEPATVSADAVARAGAYLDYAAGMLDRVTAGLALTEAVIARHLLATGPAPLNERSLYQTKGFAWARDSKRRSAALAVTRSGELGAQTLVFRRRSFACRLGGFAATAGGAIMSRWHARLAELRAARTEACATVQNVQNVQNPAPVPAFEHSEHSEQQTGQALTCSSGWADAHEERGNNRARRRRAPRMGGGTRAARSRMPARRRIAETMAAVHRRLRQVPR
jgi:hypothetical protein